jgi:hypothetical protein
MQGLLASIARAQNRALELKRELRREDEVVEEQVVGEEALGKWKGKGKEEGWSKQGSAIVPDAAVLVGQASFLRHEQPSVRDQGWEEQRGLRHVKPTVRQHRQLNESRIFAQLGAPLRVGETSSQRLRVTNKAKVVRRGSYIALDNTALLPIEELTEDGMSTTSLAGGASSDSDTESSETVRGSSGSSVASADTAETMQLSTIEHATRIQVLSNRAQQVMGIVDDATGYVTLPRRASVTMIQDLVPRHLATMTQAEQIAGAGPARSSSLSSALALLRQPLEDAKLERDDRQTLHAAADKYSAVDLLFARQARSSFASTTARWTTQRCTEYESSSSSPATAFLQQAAHLIARSPPMIQADDPIKEDEVALLKRWYHLAQVLSL